MTTGCNTNGSPPHTRLPSADIYRQCALQKASEDLCTGGHTAGSSHHPHACLLSTIIRAKRDSNCYIQKKKSVRCACVRLCSTNIGFSVGKKLCVCSTNLGFSVGYVLCTRYVCTTLAVVLIIVQLYRYLFIRSWVVVRMIPTFRPWTHTSDDSYIYQLSLVVATATVSF